MADLKPCPFCGSEAKIERHDQSDNCTVYVCRECGCTLPSGDWRDGSSWNDRVCDDEIASLRQQLAEARETNRKLHRRCQQGERVEQMTVDYLGLWLRLLKVKSRDSALFRYVLRKLIARANHIRALSHPDREGERE